jgi:hypothetical protein
MDSLDEETRLPNLMDIGQIPSDLSMDMDTEVLDPVVNNQNFCRFVLSNKGFLHSFSKITLCVSNAGKNTFPIGIGVNSLVQRCALRIGTTIVAECDDWNAWMGYKSMFIDNDINYERETYTTSRILAHDFQYKNNLNNVDDVNASAIGLKIYNEPLVNALGTAGNTNAVKEIVTENAPVFSVALADLFPFLRFNQLPLFMIEQQVSIELHFKPTASLGRCVANLDDGLATGQQFDMDLTQTKFIADYIYYDNSMMDTWASQNRVLNWTYNDYRLNKRTLTRAQLELDNVIDVGGAGRICNKLITSLEFNSATPDVEILSNYHSTAPDVINDNNQQFITNLTYNDQRLYPIDRSHPALHFHDVIQAEQNVPHVCRQEYNKQGGALTSTYTYMGYDLGSSTVGLNGKYHYICYRLNRNERVNSRGIQLELRYTGIGVGTYTHRTWLELVKEAKLENGKFSCYYV